jgi:hypothetical protein
MHARRRASALVQRSNADNARERGTNGGSAHRPECCLPFIDFFEREFFLSVAYDIGSLSLQWPA